MTVRARVQLAKRTQTGSSGTTVELTPVATSDPNDPNYSYSKYTPSGNLSLFITNPAAADFFEFGEFYDVTFEETVSGT